MNEIIERLRSKIESAPPILQATPREKKYATDVLSGQIVALIELEKLYARKSKKLLKHVRIIERTIDGIKNPDQRRVIKLRYVDGLTWDEMNKVSGFSERHCRRLHDDAMQILGIL